MYTLYILRCNNNSLYTGITNNLEHRLKIHQSGKGSKYVKAHLPFHLVYTEECVNKSTALKREIEIKKLTKQKKERLVVQSN
ncbi:GIY-YIG nuclease family protein [Candidatus Woesebacteria bacterium]|nr:GIY-YIG nuclease family protein [Candidatus Woesebacteria bacterium]